jgi:hypothetical protein
LFSAYALAIGCGIFVQRVVSGFRSAFLGAAACFPLVLGAGAVYAIPEADALRKLAVIPVFLITNDQGAPIPIPQGDKNLLLPMFLDQAKALKELDAFNKANPTAKARVIPIPMNIANDKVNEINKKLTDKKLVAPVISSEINMSKAVELLRKQGVSEKDINEGISVPVFFSKPFITVNTPKGTKAVFFLSYNDAATAAAKITGTKVELLAADITVALGRMIETKADEFVFYPTPEFFKLMQEQGQAGAKKP